MIPVKRRTSSPLQSAGAFYPLHTDRIVWLLILLLFGVRLAAMIELHPSYTLFSDDLSYIHSGIRFAETGMVTMHSKYPSAQIMPGMTYFIGLISLLTGRGTALWITLKLIWITLGSLTGWFLYHCIRLFAPRWCAVIGVLPLFRPDFIWTDNLILTETPFIFCFSALLYFTFKMGVSSKKRYFIGCIAAYLAALLLKANVGIYPLFAMGYLLAVKYSFKKLLKQGLILACALACFLVPWTVRNYIQFNAFIPLTYGAGNPVLLGTYQGIGFPREDQLDYKDNVDAVIKKAYSRYFDRDGKLPPKYQKYISLKRDGIKAKYRMRVWRANHPASFFLSYLVIKPFKMANGTFYWGQVFHISGRFVSALQYVDLALCIFIFAGLPHFKKNAAQLLFLGALYWGNIYLYSMTFAFGRYNFSLMPIRFLVIGIGMAFSV